MTDAPKGRAVSLTERFRSNLFKMEPQFAAALPAHIPVERFARVVMTAIQNNSKLLACTEQSLFNACMRAAQDGLLPDGREGAIVPFGEGEDGASRSENATWMPMIAGIRKKARNSGELTDWYGHVVYQGDEFDYQLGDDPHLHHKPALNGGRQRPITHAYSVAVFKDGTKSREVMNIDEVEDIRKRYAKSRKGPWNDPVAYPEMVVKTVLRHHSKSLPMSTDLDTLIRRDDALYDVSQPAEHRGPGRPKGARIRPPIRVALDHFASGGDGDPGNANDGPVIEHVDEKTGEVTGPKLATKATFETYRDMVGVTCENAKDGEVLRAWFVGDEQRKLRNKIGLVAEQTGECRDIVDKRVAELAE
jgi:recombination protein RecT